MNQNTLNYLNDNKSRIEKLVNSGRKRGWFPIMRKTVFVMSRCSNPDEVDGKKTCGGMTGINFFNSRGDRKVKCFRCNH